MKYIYYVSYSFNDHNGNSGIGSCSVTRQTPIESMDDILEVTTAIRIDTGNKAVTIISFSLLKSEAGEKE